MSLTNRKRTMGTTSTERRYTLEEILNRTEPSGDLDLTDLDITSVPPCAFYKCPITSIRLNKRISVNDSMCRNCASLKTAFIRAVMGGSYLFASCLNLRTLVVDMYGNQACVAQYCSELEICDVGTNIGYMGVNYFQNCGRLKTLILRKANTPTTLGNNSVFTGTPAASGGTGMTIYIPRSLYDHLGDGTTYDYKSKSYWSTVDGYGTITWAQIEGSEYEHYYADGTPIE